MKDICRKILLVSVTVILLFTAGCASEEKKLEKLQKQGTELINQADYSGAIALYQKGIEEGRSREAVIPLIQDAYTKWAVGSMLNNGTLLDSLKIVDEMIEKYPETKEYGENIIVDFGNSWMSGMGDDIEKKKQVWESIISLYYQSDVICEGIDEKFHQQAEQLVEKNLQALIDAGFLSSLDNDEFETAYDKVDDFRLKCYKVAINRGTVFPYKKILDNGKMICIEYVNSFFSFYYGEHDQDKQKSGEGVQMIYAVNSKKPEAYIRNYLRGTFKNDKVNGAFAETTHMHISTSYMAYASGLMTDNRYDGEIAARVIKNEKDITYYFTFADGTPVSLGSLNAVNGVRYYAVGSDRDPNGPRYYGYDDAAMDTVHGFYPYYDKLY